MRYKAAIIDRLLLGLGGVVNETEIKQVKQKLESVNTTVMDLADTANTEYHALLVSRGLADTATPLDVGVPENNEAIAFWIEDLESATLPKLRQQKVDV